MQFLKEIDLRDVFFVVALASLGYGLYQIHPPLAFITLGVILLIISILSFIRGSKR